MMKKIKNFSALMLVCCMTYAAAHGRGREPMNDQTTTTRATELQPSAELQRLVDATARTVIERRKDRGFKDENLSITLVDLTNQSGTRGGFASASFRPDASVYPASVVKMFYLVAAHRQMQDGELKDTPELRRALKDMIVDSSNDATHYVLDALTGTSSGVELPEAEMPAWGYKRNRVNRYFAALGYGNINVNQKTYCEDIYGRDRIFRGAKGENRNRLTTVATARLLAEIATGRAINPARSREMMELLKRDPYAAGGAADDQSHDFTARALKDSPRGAAIPGVRLWSKAGWISSARHDAAYMELPNGKRFVLVTFTINPAGDHDIIPDVAREVLAYFTRGATRATSATAR